MPSLRVKNLRCCGQISIARHFEATPTQQAIRGASFVYFECSVHRYSGEQCFSGCEKFEAGSSRRIDANEITVISL